MFVFGGSDHKGCFNTLYILELGKLYEPEYVQHLQHAELIPQHIMQSKRKYFYLAVVRDLFITMISMYWIQVGRVLRY
jgi:hypothetical protein